MTVIFLSGQAVYLYFICIHVEKKRRRRRRESTLEIELKKKGGKRRKKKESNRFDHFLSIIEKKIDLSGFKQLLHKY